MSEKTIELPLELVLDGKLTPEVIGALAVGLAYQDDPRAFPRLLQEVGRMRVARATRVTRELLALGYAVREIRRGPNGHNFGGMQYRFFTSPQL
jgi:hypothetical protein